MPIRPITQIKIHLTYRLHGSIPSPKLNKMHSGYIEKLQKLQVRQELPVSHPDSLNYPEFRALSTDLEIRSFLAYDVLLDAAKDGPTFLASPAAKKIVIDSWKHIAKQYNLIVYVVCVMSNHVHVILRAVEEGAEIDGNHLMEAHKRFTGNQLNKLHSAKGRRVWAEKPYDRDIRDGRFTQVLWYVINNPKKAGITDDPINWFGNWINPILEKEYVAPYRA